MGHWQARVASALEAAATVTGLRTGLHPAEQGAPAPLSLVFGAQAPSDGQIRHSSISRKARASCADPRRSAKATTLRTRTARSSATVTTSPSRTVWLG